MTINIDNFKKIIDKSETRQLANSIITFNNRKDKTTVTQRIKLNYIIEEFLIREDQEEYYQILLDSFQENCVNYPDILHFYIRAFLNYNIPRKACCKGHISPFRFVCDMFFENVRNAIAFANRTGGKTTNIAILNHLDMIFKAGCEVASAGSIQRQAEKCYSYFTGFHNNNEYLSDLLAKDPTQKFSVYNNGSVLEVITGSVKGFNSPHPNKARIDEIELMEWEILQEGLSMAMTTNSPTTGKEIMGQLCCSSTRKTESGTMQRLLNLAKKETRKQGGYKVYKWCIWEVLEECTRKCKDDSKYGDCPIYDICKGKAKNCRGYYKIDDFIDKAITLDKSTLDAQWFNKKPSTQIIVYGDYYKEDIHKISERDYLDRIKGRDIEYVGGIDFGSSPGHPFVFKTYALDLTDFKREVEESDEDAIIRAKIIYYTVYEYRSGSDTTQNHAEKILSSPYFKKEMIIWADPSAKQARIDLEELYGIPTLPADNAVETGIEKVRAHLQVVNGKAHYYILRDYLDCLEIELFGSDRELEIYKYRRTKEGKINTKEPEKQNDHGMDIDRYVISSSIPYFKGKYMPIYEDIDGGYWG